MPATKRKPKTTLLLETTFSESVAVDREAGVIRGVKILGKDSRNGRTYTGTAIAEAARLYEGSKVNVDHPPIDNPDAERSFVDGFGVLRGVTIREGDVFGDLHYLKSHPRAEMVAEAAERFPHSFGLSHNADGKTRSERGRTIVESVVKVRSVDIVGKPATNNGIFESEQPVQKTVKAILEAAYKSDKKRLALLLEMAGEMGETMMDAPVEMDASMSAEEQMKAAFRQMVLAAFDDETLDSTATIARIKEILAAQEKLMGGGAAAAEEPTEDDAEPTEESQRSKSKVDPTLKKLQESVTEMRRERDELKRERDEARMEGAIRSLLESMDREPTEIRVAALSAVPDKQRKALVESWPKRGAVVAKPQRTVPLAESEIPGGYKPLPIDEWVTAIS
jgi:hypothetical protein